MRSRFPKHCTPPETVFLPAYCVAFPCNPSGLLRKVCQRFTLEGHNAELWDETARRFEHVAPVELDLLPADSMLREFYAGEL